MRLATVVCALAIVAPLACRADITAALNTAAGTVEGRVLFDDLEIATSFGKATVRAEAIDSIEFADTAVVVTADGTTLRGTLNLPGLTVTTAAGDTTYPYAQLKSLAAIRRALPEPGRITDGRTANKLTYHLRVPDGYKPGEPAKAIVILHGSNMNARTYVRSIAENWPQLANEFVIIGIDGEMRNKDSNPEDPAFNYTYVNFVGKSTYKGYPGTDRESPALVSEVISELRSTLGLTRVFVGGHSQGGFLTYSLMMNYPELVDGAFPISGGLIFQCEPGAYADADLIAKQKHVPLAIVHASNDTVVDPAMSRYALEAFDDAGFPALRFFGDDQAGHRFMFLPVEKAIRWLDALTSQDAATLSAFAAEQQRASRWRDVLAAAARLKAIDPAKAAEIAAPAEAAAAQRAAPLLSRMKSDAPPTWIDDYLAFRTEFGPADAAAQASALYADVRTAQEPKAQELFLAARADFQKGDQAAGYAKYEQIVKTCCASSRYTLCKRYLASRK